MFSKPQVAITNQKNKYCPSYSSTRGNSSDGYMNKKAKKIEQIIPEPEKSFEEHDNKKSFIESLSTRIFVSDLPSQFDAEFRLLSSRFVVLSLSNNTMGNHCSFST